MTRIVPLHSPHRLPPGPPPEPADQRLALANDALVHHLVRRLQGHGVDLADLLQEGRLGLLRACADYDPSRARLSTYASAWIRQRTLRAIAHQGAPIALYQKLRDDLVRFARLARDLARSCNRPPTDDEVFDALGWPSRRRSNARDALRALRTVSLEDATDDSPEPLARRLPARPEPAREAEIAEEVASRLALLTDRERRVVVLRHGLEGEREHTLREIAAEFGRSYEWARQLHRRAVAKMRRGGAPD